MGKQCLAKLHKSNVLLKTDIGEPFKVCGEVNVTVKYKTGTKKEPYLLLW